MLTKKAGWDAGRAAEVEEKPLLKVCGFRPNHDLARCWSLDCKKEPAWSIECPLPDHPDSWDGTLACTEHVPEIVAHIWAALDKIAKG